jgi:hypothetical protein
VQQCLMRVKRGKRHRSGRDRSFVVAGSMSRSRRTANPGEAQQQKARCLQNAASSLIARGEVASKDNDDLCQVKL